MTTKKTYAATELTLDEKLAKLADLRAIPESVLIKAKKYELIELAKGLITNVKSYSKIGLAEQLVKLRAESINELELEAIAEKESEESRKERLSYREPTSIKTRAEEIRAVLKIIDAKHTDELDRMFAVTKYAGQVFEGLKLDYTPKTMKSMLTEIGKILKGYEASTDSALEQRTLIRFMLCIWAMFKPLKDVINLDYKAEVISKKAEAPEINGTALVQKAEEVLKSIPKDAAWRTNKDIHWATVACALAVVTGRRSAEILATAKFEKTESNEDNKLMFSGQTKARGSNREARMTKSFKIPCLVDADLAINGLNYLEQKRKDIDYNPDAVNPKYSRELQREIQKNWKAVSKNNDLMFKSLRPVYAALCLQKFYEGNDQSVNSEISELLGHSELDTETANSYRVYTVI